MLAAVVLINLYSSESRDVWIACMLGCMAREYQCDPTRNDDSGRSL